jgi:AmmeMemoRadiSam system protein B
MSMDKIRPPAVAGMFYPAEAEELKAMVEKFLEAAKPPRGRAPKAIIAPHAGYIYSGPVAASAYVYLPPARNQIRRVVLFGPAHRVPFPGLAASSADGFATPLGIVPLDREAIQSASALPMVRTSDLAHMHEHSLEVQLPFLQTVLADFKLVPFAVGDAAPADVAKVMEHLWGGPETLIVVSSDLSHYLDYRAAQKADRETSDAIERLDVEALDYESACGRTPIGGLLLVARQKGLSVRCVDLRNSGDTAGPRSEVVGYGAYIFD